jgi:hypothetical protein
MEKYERRKLNREQAEELAENVRTLVEEIGKCTVKRKVSRMAALFSCLGIACLSGKKLKYTIEEMHLHLDHVWGQVEPKE